MQMSITKYRQAEKAHRAALVAVKAHRRAALTSCLNDPTGGIWDERGKAIACYCDARRWAKHWSAVLSQAIVVKGITRHYTGSAHR